MLPNLNGGAQLPKSRVALGARATAPAKTLATPVKSTKPAAGGNAKLGVAGTVLAGLPPMLGVGAFAGVALAGNLAGHEILWATLLALLVALCNGLSATQLSAAHPSPAGTYEQGYRVIGQQAGFIAGWMYLCAKSSVAACAALTFGGYMLTLIDTGNQALLVLAACAVIVAMTVLLYGGSRRSRMLELGMLGLAAVALVTFTAVGLPRVLEQGLPAAKTFKGGFFHKEKTAEEKARDAAQPKEGELIPSQRQRNQAQERDPFDNTGIAMPEVALETTSPLPPPVAEPVAEPAPSASTTTLPTNLPGSAAPPRPGQAAKPEQGSPMLLAAALLCVAFTGYGRIAALGSEVREPKRTLPLAIGISLGIAGVFYAALGAVYVTWLSTARERLLESSISYPTARMSAENAPLALIAEVLPMPGLGLLLAAGAFGGMVISLLHFLPSLSRVWAAMGRRGDMPAALAKMDAPAQTPHLAILCSGAVVALIAVVGNLQMAWMFSAFSTLVYFGITNLAVLRLPERERQFPNWVAGAGLAACILLASTVPGLIWGIGIGLLIAALVWQHLVNPPKDPAKARG